MRKTLTLEMVKEQKMTPRSMVKFFRPEWSDEACNYYIWNHTCFPMSITGTILQLNEYLGTEEDLTPQYND